MRVTYIFTSGICGFLNIVIGCSARHNDEFVRLDQLLYDISVFNGKLIISLKLLV